MAERPSPNADTGGPLDPTLALEMALDAVLARYGVPLGFGNRGDRGDLASDLAATARRVLSSGTDE